jgi:hypothetical protein
MRKTAKGGSLPQIEDFEPGKSARTKLAEDFL